MLASRSSRIALVAALIAGVLCVFFIPPPLYFEFGRFTAGLPQPYFAFDPDRYLADAPQRSGSAVAAITCAKFAAGFLVVWLFYAVAQFIRRGRSSGVA